MPYKDKQRAIEYHKEYYKKNRESHREELVIYRKENKSRIKKTQKLYYKKNRKIILEKMKKYRLDNYDKVTQNKRISGRKMVKLMKRETFNHYSNGDIKCNCCGEREILFLSLDHINENGADERRKLKKGKKGGYLFYSYLKKKGYPVGYQVLCMNCNMGKHHNNGVCPHKNHD